MYTLNFSLHDPPQFTLTCISTGGPATTVTWTRDSETVSEGSVTVLDNRETAQYTHTLTVSGRLGGLYQCTVSNNKPSTASAQLSVQGHVHTYILHAFVSLTKSGCSNGRGFGASVPIYSQ